MKCKKVIGDWGRKRQCSRESTADGWCKQHHPGAVKARHEKAEADHQAKWERTPQAKLGKAMAEIKRLNAVIDQLKKEAAAEFKPQKRGATKCIPHKNAK